MRTFSVRFLKASMELDVIVTSSDNNQHFKVELVTGEPDPIILNRFNGQWTVVHAGDRVFSEEVYQKLEQAIDNYLTENSIC